MSRHRHEARFYVTAPEPYLNERARSVARQEELVETVSRLFEKSDQQELALVALERTPGAINLLDLIEDSAHRENDAAGRAAELDAERDATSPLRRGRRRELGREADRLRDVADEHRQERVVRGERLLRSGPARTGMSPRPASDPIDLDRLPRPGRDLDLGPDLGM